MKTAHQGMGISEADWTAAVRDLTAALDKFNVGQQERNDLFAVLGKLKADIVEKP